MKPSLHYYFPERALPFGGRKRTFGLLGAR